MTADSAVKARLVQYVFDEGKHGGHQAMLAIAFILRNRVRKGWSGGDWMGVLNTAPQRSAFEQRPQGDIELNNMDYRRLLIEIDDIYDGTAEDTVTEQGLYYYDTLRQDGKEGICHKSFVEKILQKPNEHPRVAQIGMILIFR